MKNRWPIEEVQTYVYGENGKTYYESYEARPISAVIEVDVTIPGCPIDRFEFVRIVQQLLQGRKPKLVDYPLCVECKLAENVCLNKLGKPCLGPVTQAGCGALCTTFGYGCEGCRGFAPEANFDFMRQILEQQGLSGEEIDALFTMYNYYQLKQMGEDAPLSSNGMSRRRRSRKQNWPRSTFASPEEA